MIDGILLLNETNLKKRYNFYFNKKERCHIFIFKKNSKYFFLFLIIIFFLRIFLKYNQIYHPAINQKDYKNNNYFGCFCAKARGENIYAVELISYYSKLGVEKFIFGDNNINGTEKLADVLQNYVNQGIVDIYEIFGSDIGQAEFNQNMYEKYKTKCKWFLFFDFDEYLYMHFQPNVSLTLQEFLPNKMFDKCEAILFNWLMYTDNDLIYYDNRTILERFPIPNYEARANSIVKCIVKGGLNKTIFYPKRSNHVPDRNLMICDSAGKILKRYNRFSITPPVYKYAVLKHFSDKTAEEYINKTRRGANRNRPYRIED